jgi:hypothetical protein
LGSAQADSAGIAYMDFFTINLLYNNADQCFNNSNNSKINVTFQNGLGCGVKIFENLYATLRLNWGNYNFYSKDTELYKYEVIPSTQNNPNPIYTISIADTVYAKLHKVYEMHSLGISVKKIIRPKFSIWVSPQWFFSAVSLAYIILRMFLLVNQTSLFHMK